MTKLELEQAIKDHPTKAVVPKSIPAGRTLAHNHVRHTTRTRNGARGFRWWTWPQDEVPANFVPCNCGYAGLPHVASREHVASYRQKAGYKL